MYVRIHRRRLWGQPGHVPPIIEKHPCIYHCLAPFLVFKSLYDNQQAAVRIDKETTEWFRIGKGVRQGCLMSPLSFNGYSEKVMRESAEALSWIGITISGRIINNLRYADDIVLVATSKETLQQLMDRVNEASGKYGLEINTKKTKVMVVSRTCEKITIA